MPFNEATMLAGLALLAGSEFEQVNDEAALRRLVTIELPEIPPPDRVIEREIAATQENMNDAVSLQLPKHVDRLVKALPGTAQASVTPKDHWKDLWHLLYYCKYELNGLLRAAGSSKAKVTLRAVDGLFDRLRRGVTGPLELEVGDLAGQSWTERVPGITGWDERLATRPLTLNQAVAMRTSRAEHEKFEALFAPVEAGDSAEAVLTDRLEVLDACMGIEDEIWTNK